MRGRHVLAGRHERSDDVCHLTAEVVQSLHGITGNFLLPPASLRLFQCPLRDAVTDGTGFLNEGQLLVQLDPARLLHHRVAVHDFEIREVITDRLQK